MNFMGGGRRVMKAMEKEVVDEDKEKVINYIQKKMDEKTQLESNGQSIFKANKENVVNRSQDVIKAKVINKIYSKPPLKRNQSIIIREVVLERSILSLRGVRPADHKIFKHNRRSKNWGNCLIKTIRIEQNGILAENDRNLIPNREKLYNQEERLKMTYEWVTKNDNHHNSSQNYVRTYL